jgi:hypothetical protein
MMTATKVKRTSDSGGRTRKRPSPVTVWEINPLVCDVIDRAQREHYRITACEVCGGPRIHSKIRPHSKCFRCGDFQVSRRLRRNSGADAARRSIGGCCGVRTASGAGTKSVSRGGPRRGVAEGVPEAQNGACSIGLLKEFLRNAARPAQERTGITVRTVMNRTADEHDGDRADARHSIPSSRGSRKSQDGVWSGTRAMPRCPPIRDRAKEQRHWNAGLVGGRR